MKKRQRVSRDGFTRWDVTIRKTHRAWINSRAEQQGKEAADVLDELLRMARKVLSADNNAERGTPVPLKVNNPGKQKQKP